MPYLHRILIESKGKPKDLRRTNEKPLDTIAHSSRNALFGVTLDILE
jgi:hypothetical protein